ncbi:CPBP family intramembrane glutamic endopeptidase [Spirosoma spitsbergense]|uniref:CPBP family intramembrane glutamic endopeptidase n=1 Tax=Spirosoma spitsbergense TaxID=431554 RepID=UPI000360A838|nr:CPBP family intramembrane glutamic endopeptidase [Spirosoma spitsbergense]
MITMTYKAPTKTQTGLLLLLAGLIGVASLLTVDFPTKNLPKAMLEKFPPMQLKLLMLVNPLLLLIISVVIGSLLYRKVALFIFRGADFESGVAVKNIFSRGVLPGAIASLLIICVVMLFQRLIPDEFSQLVDDHSMTIPARLLYGGITEEILMRFGLMTLFIWLLSLLFHTKAAVIYWVAIIGAALLFGAGHLPAMRLMVAHPSATLTLYIILANALAGVVFGWLYWRYGLVFAIIAHASAHIVLLTFDLIKGY